MTKKEKLLTPQNDFIFKKIFAKEENKDMLKEFLEEVLEIKIYKLDAVEEAQMDKTLEENKGSRIDIQSEVNDNIVINIEMQISNEHNITSRSAFSVSGLLHNNLNKGQDYADAKISIVICILSFNIFKDGDYIVSASLRRDDTHKQVSDKIKIYYIQLPKFIKQKDKKRKKLAQWLYFISQEDKEELEMAVKENVKIAEAQKQYEELISDEGIQYQIFMREKTKADIKLAQEAAYQEGQEKGEEKGMEKGEEKAKNTIAKKLLEEGLSIEKISSITNLSKEEIEKLKNS